MRVLSGCVLSIFFIFFAQRRHKACSACYLCIVRIVRFCGLERRRHGDLIQNDLFPGQPCVKPVVEGVHHLLHFDVGVDFFFSCLSCMRARCSLEHARSLSALSFPASLSLFQMTPFSTEGSSSSPLGFAIRKLETYTQVFFVLLCAPTGCSCLISCLSSLLFLLVCVALQL